MNIKIKSDRNSYGVLDNRCIGRPCLNLHRVAIRGATNSGSRTSGYRYCCGRREYRGCPQPLPEYDRKLGAERRRDGMRNA